MRHYKRVRVHGTKDELVSIECDWCRLSFETEEAFNGENDRYDDNEFTFEVQEGSNFPGGAYGKKWTFEICFVCRRKLILKLGAMKILVREEDY